MSDIAGMAKTPIASVQESGFHSIRPARKPTENLIMNVGHYGGLHQPYRTEDLISLELKSVEAAVKLAKSVNIVQEDAYIAVREILPDKDFVDGNGNAITSRSWRQPWSGFYTGEEVDTVIYKINRDVDYHNKVYCFWGLRYVNRGPGDADPVTDASSMTIKDGVNTYDIWDLEGLDVHTDMFAFKPILLKNYTDYQLIFRSKTSGGFDNVQLLGKIIEPRGETIAGTPESG